MALESNGIHPGVIRKRRVFPIVNTCGNSSQGKRLMKQLAGIEKHLEANPRDTLSQQRVSTIKMLLSGK